MKNRIIEKTVKIATPVKSATGNHLKNNWRDHLYDIY